MTAFFKLALAGAACALLQPPPAGSAGREPATAHTSAMLTFGTYAPSAESLPLAERMLSPLAFEAIRRRLDRLHLHLAPRPVELGNEAFYVRMPATMPARGYGLLVFIPASDRAELAPGWAGVLDEFGLIYVSAARSGNDQDVITRRAPLALLAARNLQQRYRVDEERVFVGGFSGGSRVALRLALAYPDLFRGALLNAGSDPIGVSPARLPARALFETFRARSRLAYVTGAQDPAHVGMDDTSAASLRRWCVDNEHVHVAVTAHAGHEVADPQALRSALRFLLQDSAAASEDAEACRRRVDQEVEERLLSAQSQIAAGEQRRARASLLLLDGTAGGLAMPKLRDLALACACGVL